MTREAHTDEALIAEAERWLEHDDRAGVLPKRLIRRLASRLATITPEREAVARIIAPRAWENWDRDRNSGNYVDESLSKADRIIALFNTGKAETP